LEGGVMMMMMINDGDGDGDVKLPFQNETHEKARPQNSR
jgi:hypothetical protein